MIGPGSWVIGLLLVTGGPTLEDIDRARGRSWCESCAGRRFRVSVDFQLRVERPDPALESAFFPVAEVRKKVVNLPRWSEDVTRGGPRYRIRYHYPELPGTRDPVPDSFQQTYLCNGWTSWKFDGGFTSAVQGKDRSRGTRFFQDYYGDMIGAELPGIVRSQARTVPAGTDEPYDVDELIGGGSYHLAGTEEVAGEACVILERTGRDRVWLATARNFVVARREWRWSDAGPLKRRIINDDWREVADGVWLPYRCRMEIMGHPTTRPDRRVGTLTATVRESSSVVSDDDFEPHFPKGTEVFDLETGERFRFGLTAAERDAQALAEAQARHRRNPPRPELARFAFHPVSWWRRPGAWLGIGIGIGGAMAAVASLLIWPRRWRRS